jgi:outer membrane biosynthesis protein TonB
MGEISESTYKKARVVGLIGSCGTGLILFLILFFCYILTPIPPYPEGGGGGGMDIEVNLGYAENGLGEIQQPDIAVPDFSEQPVKQTPLVEERPEEVLAQDNEETAAVTNPPKTQKKTVVQVKKPQPQPQKKTIDKPKPVVEKPRTVNQAALYKATGKSGSATSQGITQGATDQGSPNGSQSAATYGKGGSGGSGTGSGGGTGGGIGKGTGTGIGDGVGPGISYNLKGRSMILMRKPEFTIQQEGIVVVEITVDRTGKVINATPGKQGSTTTDKTLCAAAKKAALDSKFNLKNDAPDFQVGKITYHFKLQ